METYDSMLVALEAVSRLIANLAGCIEDAWRDAAWARALRELEVHDFTDAGVGALAPHGPCVYRIFGPMPSEPDAGDLLLYVGGTVKPRGRLKTHLGDARFATARVVALEPVLWSPSIADVERRAIRWERPWFNREGTGGEPYRADRAW